MNPARLQPLVYSCSGASSAAQMANHIALRLDRLGDAEMSCIAGVGGEVKSLVRLARSGRPILALDGCPLQCAARILQRQGIRPTWHYDLSQHGVPKRQHEDFDPAQAARMLDAVRAGLRGAAGDHGLAAGEAILAGASEGGQGMARAPSGSG